MTSPSARLRRRLAAQDGFIVVATLWLLAGLAALATVASVYIAQSANALSALDAATQWEMLGSAGVELAAYQLSAPATMRRPTHGGFGFRLADASVRVEYMSESARINLNMAPRAMIAGLFRALGAPAEAADEYAARVVAWRRTPRPDGRDTEPAAYAAADLTYVPRQAPFASADELWLVLGLPVELVEHAMPFVTVYSGYGGGQRARCCAGSDRGTAGHDDGQARRLPQSARGPAARQSRVRHRRARRAAAGCHDIGERRLSGAHTDHATGRPAKNARGGNPDSGTGREGGLPRTGMDRRS
ncbi:hypothetical protein ACVWZ3_001853 [Bradyrhizobium sp. i1.3.6]